MKTFKELLIENQEQELEEGVGKVLTTAALIASLFGAGVAGMNKLNDIQKKNPATKEYFNKRNEIIAVMKKNPNDKELFNQLKDVDNKILAIKLGFDKE